MSPALYADEEGRATMTRDVGDPGPFVSEPKETHPPRRGCRGARPLATEKRGEAQGGSASARAWHQRVSSSGYHLPDTLMYYASIH